MPLVPAFYSVNEDQKTARHVHHNNSACASGRDIPSWERKPGTGGLSTLRELSAGNEAR